MMKTRSIPAQLAFKGISGRSYVVALAGCVQGVGLGSVQRGEMGPSRTLLGDLVATITAQRVRCVVQ
jgi:hypothetical protein